MLYCIDSRGRKMPESGRTCERGEMPTKTNGLSMNAQETKHLDFRKSVGFLLAKAYQRACVIFKEEFEGYDLTPQQFGLLSFLWQEDGITQAELSAKSQIDRTTMGGLIDRLEKEELVVRRSHPDDRRAYRICLTKKGKGLEPELTLISEKAQQNFIAKLDQQEVETLKSLLEKIRS
jgi:MarR family transcriptional regulator, lower aerobic nicotinate degradation pathway regulator